MSRLFLIAVAVFFGLAFSSRAEEGPTYRLSFPALRLMPGERVAKFDLHIRSAMIVGIRSVPVGWQINIDNDPSWQTEISGTAVVGAAFLSPSALRPWFLSLLPEPNRRPERRQAIRVNASMTLASDDNIRVVELTNDDIRLTPSQARSRREGSGRLDFNSLRGAIR